MTNEELDALHWRVSSFSDQNGTCVEVALTPDDRIAMRNSNDRAAGAVFFTRAEMDAFIKGAKADEFDDLV